MVLHLDPTAGSATDELAALEKTAERDVEQPEPANVAVRVSARARDRETERRAVRQCERPDQPLTDVFLIAAARHVLDRDAEQ